MTETVMATKIQSYVRGHQTLKFADIQQSIPGQGIRKGDLETTQYFWRTVICGPNRKWWSLFGNMVVENRRVLDKDTITSQLKNYSGRYRHSKDMVVTEYQLNAAFNIKFICEALAGLKMGHWDVTHDKWTSTRPTREYLAHNECGYKTKDLYSEALKVICGKIV